MKSNLNHNQNLNHVRNHNPLVEGKSSVSGRFSMENFESQGSHGSFPASNYISTKSQTEPINHEQVLHNRSINSNHCLTAVQSAFRPGTQNFTCLTDHAKHSTVSLANKILTDCNTKPVISRNANQPVLSQQILQNLAQALASSFNKNFCDYSGDLSCHDPVPGDNVPEPNVVFTFHKLY